MRFFTVWLDLVFGGTGHVIEKSIYVVSGEGAEATLTKRTAQLKHAMIMRQGELSFRTDTEWNGYHSSGGKAVFVAVLSGAFQIEVQNGTTETLYPGDLVVFEDTGEAHRTRNVSQQGGPLVMMKLMSSGPAIRGLFPVEEPVAAGA